jgi:hypothetical protein
MLRISSTVTEAKRDCQCISQRSSTPGIWQGVAWTMGGSAAKPVTLKKEDPDPDSMRRPIAEKAGARAAATVEWGLVRRELGARLQGGLAAMEASHRTE